MTRVQAVTVCTFILCRTRKYKLLRYEKNVFGHDDGMDDHLIVGVQ